MQQLFNENDYGPNYKLVNMEQEQQLSEVAGGAATHEHGDSSSSNSNESVAKVKIEVKEEDEPSTDDEAHLFDQVEESISN